MAVRFKDYDAQEANKILFDEIPGRMLWRNFDIVYGQGIWSKNLGRKAQGLLAGVGNIRRKNLNITGNSDTPILGKIIK